MAVSRGGGGGGSEGRAGDGVRASQIVPDDENVNNNIFAKHLASSLRAAPPTPLRPAFRRRLGLVAPFDAFAPPPRRPARVRAHPPRERRRARGRRLPRVLEARGEAAPLVVRVRVVRPRVPPPGHARGRPRAGGVPFLPRRLRPRGEPVARVRRGGGAVAAAMPGGPRRPAVGVCVRLRPDGHGQDAHDHGPGGVVARGRASRVGAVSSRRRRRLTRRARRRGYARRVARRLRGGVLLLSGVRPPGRPRAGGRAGRGDRRKKAGGGEDARGRAGRPGDGSSAANDGEHEDEPGGASLGGRREG